MLSTTTTDGVIQAPGQRGDSEDCIRQSEVMISKGYNARLLIWSTVGSSELGLIEGG